MSELWKTEAAQAKSTEANKIRQKRHRQRESGPKFIRKLLDLAKETSNSDFNSIFQTIEWADLIETVREKKLKPGEIDHILNVMSGRVPPKYLESKLVFCWKHLVANLSEQKSKDLIHVNVIRMSHFKIRGKCAVKNHRVQGVLWQVDYTSRQR